MAQSVIMIVTMMAMMHICVEVNTEKGTVVRKLTGKQKYIYLYNVVECKISQVIIRFCMIINLASGTFFV